MPRQDRVKALLAAINTGTYGTDTAPSTPIRAYDFDLGIDSQTIEDDAVQPYMGAGDDHIVGKNVTLAFGVRAVGAGTVGDPPPYGALLRMCGLSETITADTEVTYEPVSEAFEDGTIYFIQDGKQRSVTGTRGTVTLTIERDNVPFLRFEMRGLYKPPTEVTMPTVDWSTWQKPTPASPTNTPFFSYLGHSAVLLRMEAALGQSAEFVSRVNDERVDITDRKATGTVVIDEPDTLATMDYEAASIAKTRGVLTVVHGTAAGNTVEFVADQAGQSGLPSEGSSEGRVTQELSLSLKPTNGNDEWRLIVR